MGHDLDDQELEATKEMFYKNKPKIIKIPTKIKRYKDLDNDNLIKIIVRQQEEIEEKTTILLAGAEKVKQLEKEIEELKKENDEIWTHLPRLD